jgi:integrase
VIPGVWPLTPRAATPPWQGQHLARPHRAWTATAWKGCGRDSRSSRSQGVVNRDDRSTPRRRCTSALAAAVCTADAVGSCDARTRRRLLHRHGDRRLRPAGRPVIGSRLAEINKAAVRTSEDPDLDSLLLRLHTETACRRGGALALRPMDLDPTQCLIRLQEKGDTVRWQPVSPTVMRRLRLHAEQRQAPADGQLLRYRNGRPITRRRYDTLWGRIGEAPPWVATQQISTHWLRHTTLTWVERNFGYAIARGYAGHTDRGSDVGSTATYVKATVEELAAAVAALTGGPHPLV